MELKHKYEGGWALTDDSCMQYARQVGHDSYEFIEMGRHGDDDRWYGVYNDTIVLSDYDDTEIDTVLRCFGYQDTDAVCNEYKTTAAANQIIAECLFEHYASHSVEPLCCGVSEAEAEATVIAYLEAHSDPQEWSCRTILSSFELAEKVVGLPLNGELTFYDAEDEDSYGVTRRRFFDAEVIIINYFGGGNPYIIDTEWQGETALQHVLHGLNEYFAESDIDVLYMKNDAVPAADTGMCEDARNLRDRDRSKLLTMQTVLAMLEKGGCGDNAVADVREVYHKQLGFDPVWRYPFCDGAHLGAVIVPVAEGFLWLPYDETDRDVGEIYITEDASLLDSETCDFLLEEMERYVKPFSGVLRYISDELRTTQ